MSWATCDEMDARFRAETCEHRPADKGDTRFEIIEIRDGMEETPILVESIDDTGTVYQRDFYATRSEAFDMIEAHREAQSRRAEAERCGAHPLEIEFAPFGPAWMREQEERRCS